MTEYCAVIGPGHVTECCAVIGPALYRAGKQTAEKRSYQTPSLSCGTGCGHVRLSQIIAAILGLMDLFNVQNDNWGIRKTILWLKIVL